MAASQQSGQRPLRLLSLDGGGIRGLSPILILKEIMRQVNQDLPPDRQLQPWQVFDLIGGTSTGGIIAVMLGKLRMTLKECEEQYLELGKEIFEPKRSKWDGRRLLDFVKANEKFDAAILEKSIKRIIREKTGDEELPLKDATIETEDESECKVFVCTVLEHNSEPAFLRSYDSDSLADPYSDDFRLWQACRATSAASTFFNAYQHGYLNFVDGAFAYNNPVQRVMIEASRLWPGRSALLISIGTGESSGITLGGNLPTLAKRMAKLVTQTERAAEDFFLGHPEMVNNGLYFRFNVPGLNNIGLEEYKEIESIGANTLAYLTRPATANQIHACVQKLRYVKPRDPEHFPKTPSDLPSPDQDALHALYDTAGDYQSHRLMLDSPVNGTCSWILEHQKFHRWCSNTSASLLWVTGNPGTGKSVLASYIAEHLTTQLPQAVVASFFFKAGQANRTESNHAISGLLHQLFCRKLDLTSSARAEFEAKGGGFTRSPESLWNISRTASVRARDTQIIFVIDALDECSEVSRNRFIQSLLSTFSSTAPENSTGWLKVLVTSRPWPEIEAQFGANSTIRLRGEDELRSISHDVRLVVQHRVNELRKNGTILQDACELVEQTLNQGADGSFLWTSLVLESVMQLKSRALHAVQKQITRIPKTLNELYDHALPDPVDGDEDTESSRQLLRILLAATRPLSLDELHLCLGINSTTRRLKDIEHEPNMTHTIKGLGGFFVRIARSQVSLVHQTAREFLLGEHSDTSSQPWKHSLSLMESNYALAKICLGFLLLEDWVTYRENHLRGVRDGDELKKRLLGGLPVQQRDFYTYATENWPMHVQVMLGSPDVAIPQELQHSITTLCDQTQAAHRIWWSFYGPSGDKSKDRSCLQVAAGKGDWVVLRVLQSVNQLPLDPDTATAAAEGRHEQTMRCILSAKDTSNLRLEHALIQAIKSNSLSVTKALLQTRNMDLSTAYNNSYPLVAAVIDANLEMLSFLLAKGADIYNMEVFYQAAISPQRHGKFHFLVDRALKTSRDEDRAKLEQLFQGLLAKLSTDQERDDLIWFIISKGLDLPGNHKLIFKLIDDAAKGRASDVDRAVQLGATDIHGLALRYGVRQTACVRILVSRNSYTRDQILPAIRSLGTNVAHFYYRLLTMNRQSTQKIPAFATREEPSTPDEDDSLNQLLETLNPSWSSVSQEAIRHLLNPTARIVPLPSACQDLLTLACLCGCLENVESILAANTVYINAKDSRGMTPLMAATLSGSGPLMEYLVRLGASPGGECWYQSLTDEAVLNDELPSTPDTPNWTAPVSIIPETPITKEMVDRDWDIIWSFLGKDSFFESPLSYGIKKDIGGWFGTPTDRQYGEHWKDFRMSKMEQSRSTILDSSEFLKFKSTLEGDSSHLYVALFDIDEGPHPESESYTDDYVFLNEVPARLIIQNLGHHPALHRAIKRGWHRLAERLVEIETSLEKRDEGGNTALHIAAGQGSSRSEPLILRLLERGANPSAVNDLGRTPLDAASDSGTIETAQLLIRHGASLEATDFIGQTSLHRAARARNTDLMILLLDSGASIDAQDNNGKTALHVAMESRARDDEPARILLGCGAMLDLTDKDGLTPLHAAIRFKRDLGLVKLLVHTWVDKGLDLGVRNNEGLTVVEFAEKQAAGWSTSEMVEFLRTASSWGYSGLDGDRIREYHEQQVAESARADSLPVEQDFWLDSDGSKMDWDEDSEPGIDEEEGE